VRGSKKGSLRAALFVSALTRDDPATFTTPVTVNFRAVLRPDTDPIEYFCAENEKDRRMVSIR
jgi:hypothetical protein